MKKGCVNPEFKDKHRLNATSESVDWVEAFWPHNNDPGKFSVADCTTSSHIKTHMMQDGEGGIAYSKFKDFSVDKAQKLMGVKFAHGLSPMPKVFMKFKSQMQDTINMNDFIASMMYPHAAERWRHYRTFFAIQDPR